jgi:hypothetical protein
MFIAVDILDGCKGIRQQVTATNARFAKLFFNIFFALVIIYNNIPTIYNLFDMWQSGITGGKLKIKAQV